MFWLFKAAISRSVFQKKGIYHLLMAALYSKTCGYFLFAVLKRCVLPYFVVKVACCTDTMGIINLMIYCIVSLRSPVVQTQWG